MLEKADVSIDRELASLLEQGMATLQDIPQPANYLPLLINLRLGLSLPTGSIRTPLHCKTMAQLQSSVVSSCELRLRQGLSTH